MERPGCFIAKSSDHRISEAAVIARDSSCSEYYEDLELRSLESKLELLKIHRQISAAKCEAFLAELESTQAASSRRRSLDSSRSGGSSKRAFRTAKSLPRSPGARAHPSEGANSTELRQDAWDQEAAQYFGRTTSCRR